MQQLRVAFSVEDKIREIELKNIILHSVLSLLDCRTDTLEFILYCSDSLFQCEDSNTPKIPIVCFQFGF